MSARRRQHGKGHSYELDGRKVPGVTKTLSDGYPKPALVNWASNVVCDYVLDRWDEIRELSPSARDKLLRRARYDFVDAASQRGTDVHALTQQLAAGVEVDLPTRSSVLSTPTSRSSATGSPRS